MTALEGKRVLLVEDELLIAAAAAEELQDAGAIVVGPCETLATALRMADSETFDVAVLDVNLRGEKVDPLAHALAGRNIPFVIVSGYAGEEWSKRAGVVVLSKPYDTRDLVDALARLLKA